LKLFVKGLLVAALLATSFVVRAADDDAATRLARHGVDQVLNLDLEQARQTFKTLQTRHPAYPFALFLEAAVDWAEAEVSEGARRDGMRERAIRSMVATAERVDQYLDEGGSVDVAQWRLTRGMANFFAARMYADSGHSIKAYRLGRAGRDELRELIAKNPDLNDAYLVLGMYEYIAGSIPRGLRWLAALFDLKGDRDLGVRYLERASAKAPVMAPEAARMLLVAAGILPETTRSCAYLPMARYTRKTYPGNPHYSVALQLLLANCGYPAEALAELAVAEKQFLGQFPNLKEEFRVIRIYAFRDQGRMAEIQKMKSDFPRDQAYWRLIVAQTHDVLGNHDEAWKIYDDIFWADIKGQDIETDSGPPSEWIIERATRYRKSPYRPVSKTAKIKGEYLYMDGQRASNQASGNIKNP